MLQVPAQSPGQGGRTDHPAWGTELPSSYMGKSRQWCKSGKQRTGQLRNLAALCALTTVFTSFLTFAESEFFVNKNMAVFGVAWNKDSLIVLPGWR